MKKFKFLKMLFLTVGMTAVFSVVNSSAMERNNNEGVVVLRRGGKIEFNHARSKTIPKVADILERNETYVFDGIEGGPTVDPQYLVNIDFNGDKVYSFNGSDYYNEFYRKYREKLYREYESTDTYDVLPQADQDSNYEVIKKDNKIYYIVFDSSLSGHSNNNIVCYELEVCGNRVWYKLNGKRRFFSTVGEFGYNIPFSTDKGRDFFKSKGYSLSQQDKDADKT